MIYQNTRKAFHWPLYLRCCCISVIHVLNVIQKMCYQFPRRSEHELYVSMVNLSHGFLMRQYRVFVQGASLAWRQHWLLMGHLAVAGLRWTALFLLKEKRGRWRECRSLTFNLFVLSVWSDLPQEKQMVLFSWDQVGRDFFCTGLKYTKLLSLGKRMSISHFICRSLNIVINK